MNSFILNSCTNMRFKADAGKVDEKLVANKIIQLHQQKPKTRAA